MAKVATSGVISNVFMHEANGKLVEWHGTVTVKKGDTIIVNSEGLPIVKDNQAEI